MDGVHLDTVQTIAVFEFLCRLTHSHVPEVLSLVFSRFDLMPFASPHTNLHFMVSVICASIENIDVPIRKICPDVTFPKVSVDERWFDLTAIFFERAQKPWDHMAKCALCDCLKFRPWATFLLFDDESSSKQLREEIRPTRVPSNFLGEPAMTSRDVETKHPSRRFTCPVEFCKLGAELDGVRHVIGHVDEVA